MFYPRLLPFRIFFASTLRWAIPQLATFFDFVTRAVALSSAEVEKIKNKRLLEFERRSSASTGRWCTIIYYYSYSILILL